MHATSKDQLKWRFLPMKTLVQLSRESNMEYMDGLKIELKYNLLTTFLTTYGRIEVKYPRFSSNYTVREWSYTLGNLLNRLILMILIDFRYQFLSINYVWCMARRETRLAVHKQSFLKWLPCDRSVVAGPKGACVTQAAWLSSCRKIYDRHVVAVVLYTMSR